MFAYLIRRLLLMIPTILGIMAVSFAIVQFVPGGPVERAIAQLQGAEQSSTAGFGGGGGQIGAGGSQAGGDISSRYRGSQGLDPKFIKELEKQYGFDKPALERFWILVRDYATFNFGKSYYRDTPVLTLIEEKLPVSISLGMWMTFISASARRSRTAHALTPRPRPSSSSAMRSRTSCSRCC
jgi:microcin C transport system permease protein